MNPRWWQVLLVSALSGFISLSHEIVWARVYNFVSGSRANAFAAMLASYLLGLAVGAWWSRRWQSGLRDLRILSTLVIGAALYAFAVPVAISWLVVAMPWEWSLPVIVIGAGWMGTVFPLLCHAGIAPDARAGRGLSHVYLANIAGCGAGSLGTGFILLEHLSIWKVEALLLLLSVWLAWWLGHRNASDDSRFVRSVAIGGIVAGLAAGGSWIYGGLYERLYYKHEYRGGMRFERVIESRHGVIMVDTSHAVYGNGAYDGRIETGLHPGSWMVRPYFLSAVHPAPREVLVIGLSAGAWTQILAHHPQVEQITAIEINHSYLDLIPHYPGVASLLRNPKVHIVVDDGRRWLKAHPDRRFDFICMNTTHHWREFASNLLSVEYLNAVKRHLLPGGIVMWNCTGSPRAARTGMEVFPHTMMIMNNCLGSDSPIVIDRDRWRSVLRDYQIDEMPVLDRANGALDAQINAITAILERDQPPSPDQPFHIMTRPTMQQIFGKARLITEDNLGDEY